MADRLTNANSWLVVWVCAPSTGVPNGQRRFRSEADARSAFAKKAEVASKVTLWEPADTSGLRPLSETYKKPGRNA